MEKKNVQWSAEETKCLVAIWASPEFQEKLQTSTRKSKLYNELSEEMAKAGFTRTPDQIINKLKKLKKDYRDTKKDLSKSGAGHGDTGDSYELLDSVMGHRPANQVTGALNSATAATTIDESGSSIYDGELSDTTTNSEPSTSRHDTSAASEKREIPYQRQAKKKGMQAAAATEKCGSTYSAILRHSSSCACTDSSHKR
ncbi:zinc finger and SCAN domain-containing protein 20-like isoform X2 [Sparus aurata]|uniref:zinc finger and SCAN domain-containing protein 20-like isoform X2 n=1 Tax=Sparus aurata TaxID=8175 RepID=UPI0011C160A7|nr:zinc finger and SCAN domain-containing protein 20-like isoform X2 [Sparus aurata]